MSCLDVQTRLSDYLDGKVVGQEAIALEAHLAGCSACRAELMVLRQAEQVLGALADPPVDEARLDALWARVASRLDAEVRPEPAAASARSSVEPAYLADAPVLLRAAPRRERWLVPVLVAGGVLTVAAVVLALSLVYRERAQNRAGAERVAQRDRAGHGPAARGGFAAPPDRRSARLGSADDAAKPDRGAAGGADHKPAASSMGAASRMGAASSKGADGVKATSAPAGARAHGALSRSRSGHRAFSARAASASRRFYGGNRMARRRRMSAAALRPRSRPASSSGGGGSSLTALLRHAGGGGGGSAASGGRGLPKRLTSADIRRGVGRVLGSARACYKRYRVAGRCRVRVVVSGATGRPASVRVLGSFASTATGRCVERAFRRARFRRFRASRQSFVFPVVFR